MTVDLILVGPWSRLLHEKVLMQKYVTYFLKIKNSHRFNQIIYSCSESNDVIDSTYFDLVLCNPIIDVNSSSTQQNQNTNNLIENSRAGVNASDADFVVKVRSDLIIADLDMLLDVVLQNQSKLIVDYEVQHSLLIPYYYPDFLVAGKRSHVLPIFEKLASKGESKFATKKWSISPFKCLTIGRVPPNLYYTEYAIWSSYLFDSNVIPSLKPMGDLNFIDFKASLKYIRRSICFVNRRKIFSPDEKFIFSVGASYLFFDNFSVLKNGFRFYLLLTYHYILFIKRSLALITQKLWL